MRKLILKMSMSADGFVAGPNGEIDWIFKSLDEGTTSWEMATLSQAGVHIMGSRTFRDMAAHWPSSTEPYAAPMNEIPKIVFSRKGRVTPSSGPTTQALKDASHAQSTGSAGGSASKVEEKKAEWARSKIMTGDLAEEIARLKQEPGKDLLAHGGASFAQSLAHLGLIDEYQLLIHPVALGRGLPLFSTLPKPVALQLVSATAFPVGAVAHVYRPM
jgi:dihydrofolate reductase